MGINLATPNYPWHSITIKEKDLIGLTSILYLSLQNYGAVTMVKTNIYDLNAKCVADAYTKFLLWVYLRVRINLCKLILFLSELDICWAETRNKLINWKHSSSDDNIKSNFVSVLIPPRKWTLLPLYYRSLCVFYKRWNKGSKFTSNFTDIYGSNIYIYIRHMSKLMLFRTVELRAI